MARAGSAVTLLCSLTVASVALGQQAPRTTLEAATLAFSTARFERARTLAREVIGSPGASRPELARAHALLVGLEIMFAHEEDARQSAEAAVALDPTVAPPEGSPEAVAPLLAVMRERRQNRPIRLRVGFSRPRASEAMRAHAELEEAPRALVGAVEILCRVDGGPEASARVEGVRVDVVLPATGAPEGGRLGCAATARTPGGAPLLEARAQTTLGAEPGDSVTASLGGPTARSSRRGGVSMRTWTWIGLGAVALATAVGVVLVVTATSSDDVTIGAPEVQGF